MYEFITQNGAFFEVHSSGKTRISFKYVPSYAQLTRHGTMIATSKL